MKTPFFSAAAGLLAEMVFPRGCACCEKPLVRSGEACAGLCSDCRNRLLGVFSEETKRCAVCGKPLISEREICMTCRRGPRRSFDRVFPVFPYQGDCKKILRAYKFASRRNLGRILCECLVRAASFLFEEEESGVVSGPADGAASFVWVPVPPRPGKIREAGWDQVDYLARLLEKDGQKPGRCLKRLGSGAQKVLDREKRRVNLRGKILVREEPPETAVVFDDVYTTGSTMDACAEALKSAGTAKVYGRCLFYD
jgi:ComF family protein